MSITFPFLSEQFNVIASATWVKELKKWHKIRQWKITKFFSKNDITTLKETVAAAENFQLQTRLLINNFPPKFVINTHQSGCQYQMVYNRSLDFEGSKTVLVQKQNLAKTTHTYTIQYSLAASSKLFPTVFICMAESGNKFGPRVSQTVEKLMDEYGNVIVICSKSRKMTKELFKMFLEKSVEPYVRNKKFFFIVDSWGGQVDATLYDEAFCKKKW
jgi:hypothetical protein